MKTRLIVVAIALVSGAVPRGSPKCPEWSLSAMHVGGDPEKFAVITALRHHVGKPGAVEVRLEV